MERTPGTCLAGPRVWPDSKVCFHPGGSKLESSDGLKLMENEWLWNAQLGQ